MYDENGNRTSGLSTGHTNKTLAKTHVIELLKNGIALPTKDPTFTDYSKHWWQWEECPYVKAKRARDIPDQLAIRKSYTDNNRKILENHLLPFFNNGKKLKQITSGDIDRLMLHLRDKGLSNKTVNNILGVLSVMLKEAVKNRIISTNPMLHYSKLPVQKKQRELLTESEIVELFNPENIDRIWNSNKLHYTANLLASMTGLRNGEVRGLRIEDVQKTFIHIKRTFGIMGAVPTKTNKKRHMVIQPEIYSQICKITSANGYLFSVNGGQSPIHGNRLQEFFIKALHRLGISEEERLKRGLTFHAWRHSVVSNWNSENISGSVIRKAVGHTTKEMTEHYTQSMENDFKPIDGWQKKYLEKIQSQVG